MAEPFFSVCIETTERAKTIRTTLESLLNQSFRDFEVILADNLSSDGTFEIAQEFERAGRFSALGISFLVHRNKARVPELENWNTPLRLATGRFIAPLEGDDRFLPGHLERAHRILASETGLGLYATGNQTSTRPTLGRIPAREFFRQTLWMMNVAPPSEAIFLREFQGRPFIFPSEMHVYAPEISLYLDIASSGLDAYHDCGQTVVREPSTDPLKGFYWRNWQDRFTVLSRYESHRWAGPTLSADIRRFQIDGLARALIVRAWRTRRFPKDLWDGLRFAAEKGPIGTIGLLLSALIRVTLIGRVLGYPLRVLSRSFRSKA